MSAAQQAFPKTDAGVAEIKILPAAHLIASQTDQPYFSDGNGLFRPLFRYISSRDIAMTTPVEAEIEPGVMYFHIDDDSTAKAQESTDKVTIHQLSARTVASYGVRGSYSERNFRDAETTLRDWLSARPEYQIAGDARGVFWSGPFTLGWFKRFEVHIPVTSK